MKVLLDNNMPVGFGRLLLGHEVTHARNLNWQHLQNGDLVKAANLRYDVLVTLDQNMRHQTSLKGLDICVLVLIGRSVRIEDLSELVPTLLTSLASPEPGEFVPIAIDLA